MNLSKQRRINTFILELRLRVGILSFTVIPFESSEIEIQILPLRFLIKRLYIEASRLNTDFKFFGVISERCKISFVISFQFLGSIRYSQLTQSQVVGKLIPRLNTTQSIQNQSVKSVGCFPFSLNNPFFLSELFFFLFFLSYLLPFYLV